MSFLLSFPSLIRNMEIVKQGNFNLVRMGHYFWWIIVEDMCSALIKKIQYFLSHFSWISSSKK